MHARDVLKDAMALSDSERADLALQLLESLSPTDDRSDAEWITEVERRAKRILAGETNGSSWAEARRRIETALAKK